MKKLIYAFTLIALLAACKKSDNGSDQTTDTSKQLAAVNTQLKGTWNISSVSSTYFSATTDDKLITPEIYPYNYYFDGQSAMIMLGQANIISNITTSYSLTTDDGTTTYLNFTDEAGIKRKMQITGISNTELKLQETISYAPAVAYAGQRNSKGENFQYNKKITVYSCTK